MKNIEITPENKVKVISTGATLGALSETRFGWRFIPYTTAHTSSRKCHATAEKAVPAWVKRHAAAKLRELEASSEEEGEEEEEEEIELCPHGEHPLSGRCCIC